jgi:ADP-ribose pyrophosphatase YjhB (NUDIX family)
MRVFQDEFLIGVTGIILNEKKEVLLFKHTYRQIKWSLPGGYLKGREHPREGLEREIEEESGMIVKVEKQLKVRTDRETARLDICFSGIYLGGAFRPSVEVTQAKFFPFEKLPLIARDQLVLIEHVLHSNE